MLKKFVYTLAAAAMTFGFAACSSDEPLAGAAGQDGLVTFTAQLPAELASRAFGEGENAKSLTVYVYEKDAKTLIETKTAEFPANGLTTTVELQLVNGKSYDILFWADAYGATGANSPFSYTASTQTVKVDYAKMASNDDKGDAFFFAEKGLEVKGAISKTIYLTRPFAQINFGTDDLDAAAVVNAFGITAGNKFGTVMSKLALTAAMPDQLNLFDGTVTTTEGAAATAFAAVAPTEETFPYGTGYDYMSMSYVLVGADRDVVDLKYTVLNGETEYNTLEIAAVPVQRNYRTNIYGSLLTSKVNFTVVIDKEFAGDDNNIKYWDGKVKEPVVNEDAKTVAISSPAELAGLAQMVNGGNKFAEYTVTLENDIDLANKPWTPIGNQGGHGEGGFYGVFDGNNHTISNLNCSATGSLAVAGLFGNVTGMVKNVKVENARVVSDHYAGGVVAYVYKMTNLNDGKELGVVNCSINGGYIETRICDGDNADKAGGVVGGVWQGGATISGNKACNVTVKGYRHIGGVIGWIDWTGNLPQYTVSNNEAENVTIIQDLSVNYKNIKPGELVGPVVGASQVTRPTSQNQRITISGSKQSNINYVFENYSAEAPFNYSPQNYVANLTLNNLSVQSMTLNTTAKLTLDGCNLKAATENPGGTNRFGIFLNVTTTPFYFTVKNSTLDGAWSHGIYVQGNADSKDSDANVIDITGCTFKDWGKKEVSEDDITTSCAFKTIRTGNFATDAACTKWADDFIKNNTFDAATMATGRKHCALGAGDQPSYLK